MNVAMNVVFIGGGNMADALIGGMLKSGFAPGQLRAVEVDGAARRRLADKYRVECYDESRKALRPGDVVVFAVKPQQMKEAARFSGLKDNAHLVISIAAGDHARQPCRAGWAATRSMVRAMPNTPALIGAGVAGLYAQPGVSEAERKQAEAILGAVGGTVWIEDEALMDAVTAVSGSGPAYVFWFIEQLAAAGEIAGPDQGNVQKAGHRDRSRFRQAGGAERGFAGGAARARDLQGRHHRSGAQGLRGAEAGRALPARGRGGARPRRRAGRTAGERLAGSRCCSRSRACWSTSSASFFVYLLLARFHVPVAARAVPQPARRVRHRRHQLDGEAGAARDSRRCSAWTWRIAAAARGCCRRSRLWRCCYAIAGAT